MTAMRSGGVSLCAIGSHTKGGEPLELVINKKSSFCIDHTFKGLSFLWCKKDCEVMYLK